MLQKETCRGKTKLGFAPSVYKQMLLNDQVAIVLDRDLFLTAQPNLRAVVYQLGNLRYPTEPSI